MGQTFLTVYDRKGRPVPAKTLVDAAGNDVINPRTGKPLVVPRDYDIDSAIAFGKSLDTLPRLPFNEDNLAQEISNRYRGMYQAFRRGGPQDLQRSYNGMSGGGGDEFVDDFKDAASFHLGLVGRAARLSRDEIVLGGGLHNREAARENPNIDTSGEWFNNPDNVRSIEEGLKAYDAGRFWKQLNDNVQGDGQNVIRYPGSPNLPVLPPMSPPEQASRARSSSLLPPDVLTGANYLAANGVPVTHRSMYLASVYGPQRVVDAINNGQVGSLAAPLPEEPVRRQIRSWVQGWHGIGPTAGAENSLPANGMSGVADDGPDDWIVPSFSQQP